MQATLIARLPDDLRITTLKGRSLDRRQVRQVAELVGAGVVGGIAGVNCAPQ